MQMTDEDIKNKMQQKRIESLPEFYRTKRVKDYIIDKMMGKSYLITGNARTGKTAIAIGVLMRIWEERPLNGVFFSWPTFMTHAMVDKQYAYDKINETMKIQSMLVIDDLGVESSMNNYEYIKMLFYTLIDNRCTNRLPTIITSNLAFEEIGKIYDERIVGRIKDLCEIIHLDKPIPIITEE